jgi:methionine-S-sulfoxide reductase
MSQELGKKWQRHEEDEDDLEEEEEEDCVELDLVVPTLSSPDSKLLLVGCGWFWTGQLKYQRIDGVLRVVAGYSGGIESDPSYDNVKDHSEALLVEFDPSEATVATLLDEWTRLHKPNKEVVGGKSQYRSFVAYLNETQRDIAEHIVEEWKNRLSSTPLYTSVEAATRFYRAEDYHQDYYLRTGQARFIR